MKKILWFIIGFICFAMACGNLVEFASYLCEDYIPNSVCIMLLVGIIGTIIAARKCFGEEADKDA